MNKQGHYIIENRPRQRSHFFQKQRQYGNNRPYTDNNLQFIDSNEINPQQGTQRSNNQNIQQNNPTTFTVNHIGGKNNMIERKRIQNYSYEKGDEIGIGFSSHVYKGKNDLTNQQVAIKVIDLKSVGDELHQHFLTEQVHTLQKIKQRNCKNLLKLQGVFKTQNNMYIVSEFCQGKDMAKVLRKKKTLTETQAQSVMKQLLQGYQELYSLKIVHRDLKLANIFIKKGQIKIADFGFSITSDKCQKKFEYNVGSPYYMPPETLKFNRYSYKSDIWALGVIAYELVHGKTPWKDKNDAMLFEKITKQPIEYLLDNNLKLSENYISFIRCCLTVQYNSRATPQFASNWKWPLAQDIVIGIIEQPKLTLQFPQGFQHKKFTVVKERHTILHSNSLNENQLHLLGPALMKHQSQSNNDHYVINNDKKQAPLLIRKGSLVENSQLNKNSNPIYSTQQALLAQLHYCRFLSNLYEELQKATGSSQRIQNSNIDKDISQLKLSIKMRIVNKMQLMNQISKTGKNLLKLPGFESYNQTQSAYKLKQVINQYYSKFLHQFSPIENTIVSYPELTQKLLIKTITYLKQTLQTTTINLRLLELLTCYYQVLELEKKNNPHSFAKVAKMDLLSSKKVYQNVAVDRLLKKLEILNL